jgi:hypothetical protein
VQKPIESLYSAFGNSWVEELKSYMDNRQAPEIHFTEPPIPITDVKEGYYVNVWLIQPGGWDITEKQVQGISYKYDENTGEKYKVVHASGSSYDSRTGQEIRGYTKITPCKQPIEP